MARSFISSRAHRMVALLLLLAMPLHLAGAAAFRASGDCCGHGRALAALVTTLVGQPCADHDAPSVKSSGLATRAVDCVPPPTIGAAPCSDCGMHCAATAWVIAAPATASRVDMAPFIALHSPLAVVPAPDPDRLERPPRIVS
jgi:hypothetical protein